MTQKRVDRLGIALPQTEPPKNRRPAAPLRDSNLLLTEIVKVANCFYVVLPLPPNALSPNSRNVSHWSSRSKNRKLYGGECGWAIKAAHISLIKQRVRLHFSFYMARCPGDKRARFYDIDNATSGVKSAIDALKTFGVIVSDNKDHVELGRIELYSKKAQHRGYACILLTIEPVG